MIEKHIIKIFSSLFEHKSSLTLSAISTESSAETMKVLELVSSGAIHENFPQSALKSSESG